VYENMIYCEHCFEIVQHDDKQAISINQSLNKQYEELGIEDLDRIEKIKEHEWDLEPNG